MITPEALLAQLHEGPAVINGCEYDLAELVRIPADADLETLVREQSVHRVAWARVLSKCRARADRLTERLERAKADTFHMVWRVMEERERDELQQNLFDEDEARDEFRRKKAVKRKVRSGDGLSLGRWRRNFSDDYVWSMVNTDAKVVDLQRKVRNAKEQLELAYGVKDALEHRMRCISHLVSLHRDDHTR